MRPNRGVNVNAVKHWRTLRISAIWASARTGAGRLEGQMKGARVAVTSKSSPSFVYCDDEYFSFALLPTQFPLPEW